MSREMIIRILNSLTPLGWLILCIIFSPCFSRVDLLHSLLKAAGENLYCQLFWAWGFGGIGFIAHVGIIVFDLSKKTVPDYLPEDQKRMVEQELKRLRAETGNGTYHLYYPAMILATSAISFVVASGILKLECFHYLMGSASLSFILASYVDRLEKIIGR